MQPHLLQYDDQASLILSIDSKELGNDTRHHEIRSGRR